MTTKKVVTIILFFSLTIICSQAAAAQTADSFFSLNHILAYYGSPYTRKMGILGDHSPEKLATLLKVKAAEYTQPNNGRGVITAFHIVYASVQPKGEIRFVKKEIIEKYIQVAKKNDMLVILDHQLGRHPVEKAISELLRYAEYENVHFAIDPEWRTENPGNKIGSVSGQEVNKVQELIQQFLQKHQIPGKKILVVHQFRYEMLTDRQRIKADYPRIQLVHTMDGFGAPFLKKDSFAFNAKATNMPLKGFKLFYNDRRSWSYDQPLMSPAEVLALKPQPVLIMYQ